MSEALHHLENPLEFYLALHVAYSEEMFDRELIKMETLLSSEGDYHYVDNGRISFYPNYLFLVSRSQDFFLQLNKNMSWIIENNYLSVNRFMEIQRYLNKNHFDEVQNLYLREKENIEKVMEILNRKDDFRNDALVYEWRKGTEKIKKLPNIFN